MAKSKNIKDANVVLEKEEEKEEKVTQEQIDIEDEVVEETKKEKKEKKQDKKKEKKEKTGLLREINKEMKKVVWPKGSEIFKYTMAVLVFCLLLCGFFALMELLSAFVKGLFA